MSNNIEKKRIKRGTFGIQKTQGNKTRVFKNDLISQYGRETIYILFLSLGIVSMLLFILETTIASQYFINGAILSMILILIFLYIDTMIFNKHKPEMKNHDAVLFLTALILILVNFIISGVKTWKNTPTTLEDITIYMINFAFSMVIISFVFIKALIKKASLKKQPASSNPSISKIYYLSSITSIGVIVCFVAVISTTFLVSLNDGMNYSGAVIDDVATAWSWADLSTVLWILVGFISTVIYLEWRLNILGAWDDEILEPYPTESKTVYIILGLIIGLMVVYTLLAYFVL